MNPVEYQATLSLTLHPLVEAQPRLLELADSTLVALVARIADLGLIEPLKICKMRIVDGRLRWLAAKQLGLEQVPCIEAPEDDVYSVLLDSLAARKHLTKSALAFLAFPLLEKAMKESRDRMVACRSTPGEKVGTGRVHSVDSLAMRSKTVEELAGALGVSRSLLFLAGQVHADLKRAPAEKAATVIQALLAGELDLGGAQHSLAGHRSTAGLERGSIRRPEKIILDGLESMGRQWKAWEKIPGPERKKVLDGLRLQAREAWPEEVQDEIRATLSLARKTPRS